MTPEAIERMYDLDEGVTYAPGPIASTETPEERAAITAWIEKRFARKPLLAGSVESAVKERVANVA